LRLLRIERGLSQVRMAELADFHRTYVSQLGRCVTNISIYGLERIANVLDAAVVDLLGQVSSNEETIGHNWRRDKKKSRGAFQWLSLKKSAPSQLRYQLQKKKYRLSRQSDLGADTRACHTTRRNYGCGYRKRAAPH